MWLRRGKIPSVKMRNAINSKICGAKEAFYTEIAKKLSDWAWENLSWLCWNGNFKVEKNGIESQESCGLVLTCCCGW